VQGPIPKISQSTGANYTIKPIK